MHILFEFLTIRCSIKFIKENLLHNNQNLCIIYWNFLKFLFQIHIYGYFYTIIKNLKYLGFFNQSHRRHDSLLLLLLNYIMIDVLQLFYNLNFYLPFKVVLKYLLDSLFNLFLDNTFISKINFYKKMYFLYNSSIFSFNVNMLSS